MQTSVQLGGKDSLGADLVKMGTKWSRSVTVGCQEVKMWCRWVARVPRGADLMQVGGKGCRSGAVGWQGCPGCRSGEDGWQGCSECRSDAGGWQERQGVQIWYRWMARVPIGADLAGRMKEHQDLVQARRICPGGSEQSCAWGMKTWAVPGRPPPPSIRPVPARVCLAPKLLRRPRTRLIPRDDDDDGDSSLPRASPFLTWAPSRPAVAAALGSSSDPLVQ